MPNSHIAQCSPAHLSLKTLLHTFKIIFSHLPNYRTYLNVTLEYQETVKSPQNCYLYILWVIFLKSIRLKVLEVTIGYNCLSCTFLKFFLTERKIQRDTSTIWILTVLTRFLWFILNTWMVYIMLKFVVKYAYQRASYNNFLKRNIIPVSKRKDGKQTDSVPYDSKKKSWSEYSDFRKKKENNIILSIFISS